MRRVAVGGGSVPRSVGCGCAALGAARKPVWRVHHCGAGGPPAFPVPAGGTPARPLATLFLRGAYVPFLGGGWGRRPQIRGWRAGGSRDVASSTPATQFVSPAKGLKPGGHQFAQDGSWNVNLSVGCFASNRLPVSRPRVRQHGIGHPALRPVTGGSGWRKRRSRPHGSVRSFGKRPKRAQAAAAVSPRSRRASNHVAIIPPTKPARSAFTLPPA